MRVDRARSTVCAPTTQQSTKRVAEMSESSTEQPRTILVYRRTHRGDPDNQHKVFGFHDCMGSVRNWKHYDAVIGIGGLKPWPGHEGIAQKITWVGIGPIPSAAGPTDVARMQGNHPDFTHFRGPLVKFKEFFLWDENGPSVKDFPKLYKYMFADKHISRAAMNDFPPEVQRELENILKMATHYHPRRADTADTPADQVNDRDSKHPTSCVKKRS